MLRRHGISSDVKVGIARARRPFSAHAWLEHDGVVLNDDAAVEEHFLPFDQPLATSQPDGR